MRMRRIRESSSYILYSGPYLETFDWGGATLDRVAEGHGEGEGAGARKLKLLLHCKVYWSQK